MAERTSSVIMDTPDETEKLKRIREIYERSSCTILLLDRTLKCVFSNNPALFSEGSSLGEYSDCPLIYPLKEKALLKLFIGGEYFCARILPQFNRRGEAWLYVCELIDGDEAALIAQRTDAAAKVFPLYSSIKYNLGSLWRESSELQRIFTEKNDYRYLERLFRLESSLANVDSSVKNAFDYADMLFSEPDKTRINAVDFVSGLVDRCNAALAKCGRRVELICDPAIPEIYADGRHAAAALVNAVQNALLYSPRDSVPIAALYESKTGSQSFVTFRLTNDNIMFTQKDFKSGLDVNFNYQRLGYGIPIIKRFAEECGGSVEIADDNGRVSVTLSVPAARESYHSRFEKPYEMRYDTGIPDIAELKMREVAAFFGERE